MADRAAALPVAAARQAAPEPSGTAGTTGTGGTGVNTLPFSFFIGADVTDQEPQPVATRGNLLTIMKSHGFNYIRLRTFVDPKASDGYDKTNGYGDIAHTVDFGKQIKDAGMGLLARLPLQRQLGRSRKAVRPRRLAGATTIAALATALHDYTKDAITQLVAAARAPTWCRSATRSRPACCFTAATAAGSRSPG